jgi:hypothetical protein
MGNFVFVRLRPGFTPSGQGQRISIECSKLRSCMILKKVFNTTNLPDEGCQVSTW